MSAADFKAIGELLDTYYDGLYHCDIERLRQVLHPAALYACASDGKLLTYDMATYFSVVAQRQSAASQGLAKSSRIVRIEFAGPVTAWVHFECVIPPRRFDDRLTLVKLDGRWQIIAKVFHYETLSAG
jgi:4-oxalocrotonate tautomerase